MSQPVKISSLPKSSFHYGYRIVLAGAVLVFFGSVIHNLAKSRGLISNDSGTASTGIFFSVILFLIPLAAGPLIVRYGPRLFILLGIVFAGTGAIAFRFGQPPGNFSLSWILIAIGYSAGFTLPIYTAASHWFKRRRAFVLAVFAACAYAGWSLNQIPALKDWDGKGPFLNNFTLWFGFLILAAGIPLALFFKPRPDSHGSFPEREDRALEKGKNSPFTKDRPSGDRNSEFLHSLKNKTFWLLTAAVALGYGAASAGLMVNIKSRVSSGQALLPPESPEGLGSLILVAVILVFGYLGDKFSKRYLLAIIVSLQSASFLMAIAAKGPAFVLSQQISSSFMLASTPLFFALCADYFGTKALATHYAYILFLASLFGNLFMMPLVFFSNFSENWVVISVAAIMIGFASAVLFLVAKPPQMRAENDAEMERTAD